MRLAVAGNQWITRYLVEVLSEHGFRPDLLINMDETWADRISGYSDLGPYAEEIGCQVYRPDMYNLSSEKDRSYLSQFRTDVILVFGWQRLIPDWLIERSRLGVWGVHGGPEKPPRCRGRAVFNWAILLGYDKFYMYLFRITPEVDEGEIVDIQKFNITNDDDILSIYHKNCVVSTSMFLQNLPEILSGKVKTEPQPTKGATYLPKRDPADSGIAWNSPTNRISNLIRAVAPPYPAAFTELGKDKIYIYRGHEFDKDLTYAGEPGEIMDFFPNGHFLVRTGDGALYVREWGGANEVMLRKGLRFAIVSGRQNPDPDL